jgi:hypothetical protein
MNKGRSVTDSLVACNLTEIHGKGRKKTSIDTFSEVRM